MVLSEEMRLKKKLYDIEYRKKNKDRIIEKNKRYYLENKSKIDERTRRYNRDNKERLKEKSKKDYNRLKREFLNTFKRGKSCEICGYNEHYEILQFHHKDKRQKEFNLGDLQKSIIKFKNNRDLLQKEVDKCILLCPNCHSLLHFKEKQRGTFYE